MLACPVMMWFMMRGLGRSDRGGVPPDPGRRCRRPMRNKPGPLRRRQLVLRDADLTLPAPRPGPMQTRYCSA
jgi:hypothetical protein